MPNHPQDDERELEVRVVGILSESGFAFEQAASVIGLEADFIVRSPHDQTFILLELKILGRQSSRSVTRTLHLAARVQDETGARLVLLVAPAPIPQRLRVKISSAVRVVELSELREALELEFAAPTTHGGSFTASAVISAGRVFAAMPFDPGFDDVFFVGIRRAAEALGLGAYRVDYDDYSGDVVERMKGAIRASLVVVADLTEQRPNVLYEMGFAHAAGIPVVPIYADARTKLPFDVSHENTLAYNRGQTTKLVEPLRKRIEAVVSQPRRP